MGQTLAVVVAFVAAIASLPWLVRRLQQRQALGGSAANSVARVLATVALGPQQRVVTVEVGPENARACLVLGVTAQQITCLHVLQPPTPLSPSAAAASFAGEMARASVLQETANHA